MIQPILEIRTKRGEETGTSVWVASPLSDKEDSNQLALDEQILSKDEMERARRFRFRSDYLAYVTAHAMLRRCLSQQGDVAPEACVFRSNRFGRPAIVEEQNRSNLRFSISHTRKLVACAVTTEADCGVDVEEIGRVSDPLQLAESQFSAVEIESLKAVSGHRRDELFTGIWCLKEAYLKARGTGLAAPLSNFGFVLTAPLDGDLRFHPPPDDDASFWRFRLVRPRETHFAAIAVRDLGG